MRRKLGYLLLLVLLQPAAANPRQGKPYFKRLDKVQVVVEDVAPIGEEVGITKEGLQSRLPVALKRNIPRLNVVENLSPSMVYLNANLVTATTGVGQIGYVVASRAGVNPTPQQPSL